MCAQGSIGTAAPKAALGTAGWAIYVAARLGPLFIAWADEGVTRAHFGADPPDDLERWAPELGEVARPSALPKIVASTLDAYFAGGDIDPATLPVRIAGTRFQRRVWTALREVHRGEVRTYAGLASDAGSPRGMRAVGSAMGANPIPILVPCHRIVGAGLALGGYSGGIEKKRLLLELEGVQVRAGRVLPGQLDLL